MVNQLRWRSEPALIDAGSSQTAFFRFMTPGRNYAFE